MSLIHVPPEVSVLAMDVHKNSISTALLEPDATVPLDDKISSDDAMVRRLIARFDDRSRVWACYEGARPVTSWRATTNRKIVVTAIARELAGFLGPG